MRGSFFLLTIFGVLTSLSAAANEQAPTLLPVGTQIIAQANFNLTSFAEVVEEGVFDPRPWGLRHPEGRNLPLCHLFLGSPAIHTIPAGQVFTVTGIEQGLRNSAGYRDESHLPPRKVINFDLSVEETASQYDPRMQLICYSYLGGQTITQTDIVQSLSGPVSGGSDGAFKIVFPTR